MQAVTCHRGITWGTGMNIRGFVTAVGLSLGILAVITALETTEANPCGTGSKGWQEVCKLQGQPAEVRVFDDGYSEQLQRMGIR